MKQKSNKPRIPEARIVQFVTLASGKQIPVEEVTEQQWRDSGFKRDPITGKLELIGSGWRGFDDSLKGLDYVNAQRKFVDALEPVLLGQAMDMALMKLVELVCDQISNISDVASRASALSAVCRTIERSVPVPSDPPPDEPAPKALH